MSNEEIEPTEADLVEFVKRLRRRIMSLDAKLKDLSGRAPDVKRMIAYMTVLDGYQKAMDKNLRVIGYFHALKNEEEK